MFYYSRVTRPCLLILPLLLLTGCGFHLRGSVQLPPALAMMAVVDAVPATEVAPVLRRALLAEDVRVEKGAPVVLQLHAASFAKRVLSVDSVGRVQEYGLSYTLRFSLRGPESVVWLPEESIVLSRDLRFDSTAVLGTAEEEFQLKEEMRRDAVLQILRRLQHAGPPTAETGK
jgi:LPS-assembly lipoprotein